MYKPDKTLRQQFDQIADAGMTRDGRAVVEATRVQTEALLGPLADLSAAVESLNLAVAALASRR